MRANNLEKIKALTTVKLESGLEWFICLESPMARKVNKSVVMEAIKNSDGCCCFRDETCDLGIETPDDLDLASDSWK